MLFRSHLRNGRSIIGLAESDDGFHFRVHPEPFLTPTAEPRFTPYEEFGVEDPRICPMDDTFLITYSAYSRHEVRVALAKTDDFTQVERIAMITQADYRNVVIFPGVFAGRYARLDRPHSDTQGRMVVLPYIITLIAITSVCFAVSYTMFMQQEIRSI